MNNTNTGGPAFPFVDSASPLEHPGMTLRDYFAAKALPQMMEVCGTRETAAIEAYRVADAMLSARGTEKRGDNDQD